MKRVLVLVGLGLVLVLSLAVHGTASAASSFSVNPKGDLSATKTDAVVTGTIICTSGTQASVQVTLLQTSGQVESGGTGFTTVSCSGQMQTWALTVSVSVGSPLKHGPATVIASTEDFPTLVTSVKL
jgi:hypothetical protein